MFDPGNSRVLWRCLRSEKGRNSFISDVRPFFYGRRIVYVDVGTFRGSVLKAMLESGVSVREAHLSATKVLVGLSGWTTRPKVAHRSCLTDLRRFPCISPEFART